MTWDLVTVGEAIAAALVLVEVDGLTVYDSPPSNLNPPALVVSFPQRVEFGTVALGLDTATVPVICVVGYSDPPEAMSDLIRATRAALAADRKLGGAVAMARSTALESIRTEKVGGIDVLAAQLILTVEC